MLVVGSPTTADVAEADATFGLDVDVTRSALPTGAATAALQLPNSHDVTVDNAAGASAVNIQDGGNSITVDGTVAISGSIDTELPAAAALVDNTANPTVPAVGAFLMGFDGTNWDRLQTGAATGGALKVDGSAVTQPISAASLPLPTGAATLAEQQTQTTALQLIDNAIAGSEMQVDVVAALPAGTNNIGDVDVLSIAAGDNNIGNVDVVTLPALVAGTANIGDVDIASGPTGVSAIQVQGTAAHDAATVGNPVLGGAQMETMADSAPGTRAGTDGDVVKLATSDGALYVIPTGPQTWAYHENSSSALTDTSVHAAPGAGLSLFVTDIVCSTGAATAFNVFFEEGASTVLGPYYLEAVAGRGVAIHLGTPKKITANTALTVTTSAAIAHSIDVTGFIGPG